MNWLAEKIRNSSNTYPDNLMTEKWYQQHLIALQRKADKILTERIKKKPNTGLQFTEVLARLIHDFEMKFQKSIAYHLPYSPEEQDYYDQESEKFYKQNRDQEWLNRLNYVSHQLSNIRNEENKGELVSRQSLLNTLGIKRSKIDKISPDEIHYTKCGKYKHTSYYYDVNKNYSKLFLC